MQIVRLSFDCYGSSARLVAIREPFASADEIGAEIARVREELGSVRMTVLAGRIPAFAELRAALVARVEQLQQELAGWCENTPPAGEGNGQ